MRVSARAAISAASFVCVLGAAAVSAPSLAFDAADAPIGSATAMLAAVTSPLLAVDVRTLQARAADQAATDFSTAGTAQGEATSDNNAQAAENDPQSLSELVAANSDSSIDGDEERCLASSVYYESKGEPLSGQLAVAQTILNRSKSGRFPESVCGVVRQPGQFSFLRGGDLPDAPSDTTAWHNAVAIAKIAQDGLWKQVAPAALYFHARRVSPGWGKIRVASIGNHIFFR